MICIKQIAPIVAGAALLAVVSLLTGCATSSPREQALACPQCKVATVTSTVPVLPQTEDGSGNLPPEDKTVTETSHSCPDCQSALTTFFNGGKLRHQCSICEHGQFSCPVAHR